jgi:hypothetical protein
MSGLKLCWGLASGGKDLTLNREFWKDLKAEAMSLAKTHRVQKKTS